MLMTFRAKFSFGVGMGFIVPVLAAMMTSVKCFACKEAGR